MVTISGTQTCSNLFKACNQYKISMRLSLISMYSDIFLEYKDFNCFSYYFHYFLLPDIIKILCRLWTYLGDNLSVKILFLQLLLRSKSPQHPSEGLVHFPWFAFTSIWSLSWLTRCDLDTKIQILEVIMIFIVLTIKPFSWNKVQDEKNFY